MTTYIPRAIAWQIRQATNQDILSVIGEFVRLERKSSSGKARYIGLCPFHDDKNPSLDISDIKGVYYCRSCGASGNAFQFLEKHLKLDSQDVLLRQARIYDIQIPEETPEAAQERADHDRLLEVLSSAAVFYVQSLHSGAGRSALDYLKGDRGLTDETIASWQLGYAPSGPTALYRHLLDRGYEHDFIVRAGLVIQRKDNSWADPLRSRLIIPVCNATGQIVGFGGRALGDESSKYLNTGETELFLKSELLFGLDRARRAIKSEDRVLVVEGYFDVITAHQSGLENVVASMGTAFGSRQVTVLTRLTRNLITGFDGDSAGRSATDRTLGKLKEVAYRDQINLRVMSTPNGKDLDEYLRDRPQEITQLLDQSIPWLNWQFAQLVDGKDVSDSEVFRQAVNAAVEHLRHLENPTTRSHYIRHCAQLLSQGDTRYALQLEKDLREQVQRSQPSPKPQRAKGSREMAEAQLLWIYLHHEDRRPQISQAIEARELIWSSPDLRRLWHQIISLEFDECDDLLWALSLTAEAKAITQLAPPTGDLDDAIQSAIAALEQARQGDRCRQLLSEWLRSPHPLFVHLLKQELCQSTD